MIKEEWRAVVGYEGLYEVSNLGTVKNIKKGKTMSQWKCKYGYWFVGLNKNGKQKFCKVHRLVAEAFIPNPENKPQVDHINGNKNDNYVTNLRWATASENVRNPNTFQKLLNTVERSKKAIVMLKDNVEIKRFDSLAMAAEYVDGSAGNICSALKGNQKTSYGYVWRYV